jgi:hypothetical protein
MFVMAALDKNLIPNTNQTAENARNRHFGRSDLEQSIQEYDISRDRLEQSSALGRSALKTAVVLTAVAIGIGAISKYGNQEQVPGSQTTPAHIQAGDK